MAILTKTTFSLIRNGLVLLLSIALGSVSCQPSSGIEGDWLVMSGRINRNYEQASPYSYTRVSFLSGRVELSSGFFYLINEIDDSTAVGRYPFVYYGNAESYKVVKDSLFVYSEPYESWDSFKMIWEGENELKLTGNLGIVLLKRTKPKKNVKPCSIEYLRVHVSGGEMDLFKINYRVTYFRNGKAIFEEKAPGSQDFRAQELHNDHITFKSICNALSNVDLSSIKPFYPTQASDFMTTKIEIGLTDGQIIRSELQNEDYPEELRFALIPVLYSHQQILFSEFPPIR